MPNSFQDFRVKVENHLATPWRGALTFGAPLPPGAVREGATDGFHLQSENGETFPLEWRPLTKAPDGTVLWAQFCFPAQLHTGEFRHLQVSPGSLTEYSRLELSQTQGEIRIVNGEEEIVFRHDAKLGLASLSRAGVALLDGAAMDIEMEFESGAYCAREPLELSIHHANSFEIIVQSQGEVRNQNGDSVWVRVRYVIQLGRDGFDVNVLFSNRRASDDELVLRRLAMRFGLSTPLVSCHVRQSSSDNLCLPRDHEIEGGIEIENGAVRPGVLPVPSQDELWPFFKKLQQRNFFERVAPHAGVQLQQGGAVFGWKRSTLLEANGFAAQGRSASLELVCQKENGRRIPQGFSRSFDFSVSTFSGELDSGKLDPGKLDSGTLENDAAYRIAAHGEYSPLISVHPGWFIDNRVEEMHRLLPYQPEVFPRLEKMMWREWARQYWSGFYDLGDYPTYRGNGQFLAQAKNYTWNNNEEDNLKGIGLMLMRTGDPSYREDLKIIGRHLLEVDRVAHSSHPLQDGVLLAHSPAHFDGPGYPSHCWAEGVLLYYKLTGDDDALDVFLKLCDCLLHWCEIPDALRFSDAREMGVPLTNFAHAFQITRDEKFHRAAHIYIDEYRRQMQERGGLVYDKGGVLTPYAEYVAVEGLWDWYELVEDSEEIKTLLLDVIEWIGREQLDAMGVYDGRSTSESLLHPFYIAYLLTEDEAWLERGRPGLDAALSQHCAQPLMKFGSNGGFYREAWKRGWLRDELVPLDPSPSHRAVMRQYSEPMFRWEKKGAVRPTLSGAA